MSKFVTEASLEAAKAERVKLGLPEPTAPQNYDPRTLYERLQEQKTKKDDEFQEMTRFSNLIKRLDEDEVDFLLQSNIENSNTKRQIHDQDKEELEKFRQEAGSGPLEETIPVASVVREIASVVGIQPSASSTGSVKGRVIQQHKKQSLEGVVRKRKGIETGDESADKKSEEPAAKKKAIATSAAQKPPVAKGLSLLGAYDSDDEDS
ncbi:hypothetical protein SmJEL517_g02786 [Synchytrium microbalum]|uniref:FAM192A/Fyv6 N-terminal domain-containing protein n=1 Tax=Synchytrium microbalum TaxID=1806994 RepID=A0A507C543_9FUNG|nr:uncharacterized protein SmJEL517_g02786 [Synchytrium microbalum]TPX34498.1 hypothetical protein SmJEL517_g02786 [Synchytrium microbalum]